ncbi:MAG TPA: hypothetical protein VJ869_04565 [Sphaerochaeta sp.]|nr:hypothetical protein [Sphaerochaeta sp.]
MARKKIVFVIVEGPSDAEALEVLLNQIFDNPFHAWWDSRKLYEG